MNIKKEKIYLINSAVRRIAELSEAASRPSSSDARGGEVAVASGRWPVASAGLAMGWASPGRAAPGRAAGLSPARQMGIGAQQPLLLCCKGYLKWRINPRLPATLAINEGRLSYFESSQNCYCWPSPWHLLLIWIEFTPAVNHPSKTDSCS